MMPTKIRYKLLFLILIAISLSLGFYAVFTTSIESIDIGYLPIFRELPPAFFAGFALLLLATVVWYFSPQTLPVHYLLILFWVFYLFVGPEMTEVNVRGIDTFYMLNGILYLEKGTFTEFWYSPFPGYFLLAQTIYRVTGTGFFELARIVSLLSHVTGAVVICGLATSLLRDQRLVLLMTLLSLAFLWISAGPHPVNLGFLLLLLFMTVAFSPRMSELNRRILLLVIFTATVITHGFASLLVLAFTVFFRLMTLTGRTFGYIRELNLKKGGTLFILFEVIIFVTWMLYTSDWVVEKAVINMIYFLQNPLESIISHYTFGSSQWRDFILWLTYSYFAVLLIWFLEILRRNWLPIKLSLERMFPILCAVIPFLTLVATGSYAHEGFQRGYYYAIPFLTWFFTRESNLRRRLTVCFLLILLVFSFVLRYSAEYVNFPRTTELRGDLFICERIHPTKTVAVSYWGYPRDIVHMSDQPSMIDLNVLMRTFMGRCLPIENIDFIIKNERLKNIILYIYGNRYWDMFVALLLQPDQHLVYSNGDFKIYSRIEREL